MREEDRNALIKYRPDSARERLDSAKLLLDDGKYKDSISRSYYAMFTSVRALLAKEGIDFARHSSVISYFQKEYIKDKKLDVKYSKYLSKAFQIRNNADYNDFYIASKQDADTQYKRAKEFHEAIFDYINETKPIEDTDGQVFRT